jgi:hypothetical protein
MHHIPPRPEFPFFILPADDAGKEVGLRFGREGDCRGRTGQQFGLFLRSQEWNSEYSLFSLIRVSLVVKRQSILQTFSLRTRFQAVTSRFICCSIVGMRSDKP